MFSELSLHQSGRFSIRGYSNMNTFDAYTVYQPLYPKTGLFLKVMKMPSFIQPFFRKIVFSQIDGFHSYCQNSHKNAPLPRPFSEARNSRMARNFLFIQRYSIQHAKVCRMMFCSHKLYTVHPVRDALSSKLALRQTTSVAL